MLLLLVVITLVMSLFAFIVLLKLDADLLLILYSIFCPNLKSYKGKTSWIVGASTGIGQAIAFELARNGSRLILTATSLDKLKENRKKCIELSQGLLKEEDVHIACFNVADKQQMRHHFQEVITKFGHIDVLFNNAGISRMCSTVEIDDDDIDQVMNVNFLANIRLSQLATKEWLRTGRQGKIIVTSSIASHIPFPMSSLYNASKAALNSFYNPMRMELSFKGISITVVNAGTVYTEIVKKIKTADNRTFKIENFQKKGMVMHVDRCAYLMAVAGANRFGEIVIANPPQLLMVRLFEHFGSFIHPLLAHFSSEKMLKSYEYSVFGDVKQD